MNRRNATWIALCAVAVGSVSACGGSSISAITTTAPPTTTVPPTTPPVDCQVMFGAGNTVSGEQPTCLISGQLTSVVTGKYTCSNAKNVNYNDFAIWLDDGIVAAKPAAGGVTQTQLEAVCGVVPTTTAAPPPTVPPTPPPTAPPTPEPTTPPPSTPDTIAADPNRPSPVPGASPDMAAWMNQIIDRGFCVDEWITGEEYIGERSYLMSEMYVCDAYGMTLIRFVDDSAMKLFLQNWLDYSAGQGLDRTGAELLRLDPLTVMFPLSRNTALDNLAVIIAQGMIGGERVLIADIMA